MAKKSVPKRIKLPRQNDVKLGVVIAKNNKVTKHKENPGQRAKGNWIMWEAKNN